MKRVAILLLSVGLMTLGCVTGPSSSNGLKFIVEMKDIHTNISENMADLGLLGYNTVAANYCDGDFSYRCDARYGSECFLPAGITSFDYYLAPFGFEAASYNTHEQRVIDGHTFYVIADDPKFQGGHYLWVQTDCKGKDLRYDIVGAEPNLTTKNAEVMAAFAKVC